MQTNGAWNRGEGRKDKKHIKNTPKINSKIPRDGALYVSKTRLKPTIKKIGRCIRHFF